MIITFGVELHEFSGEEQQFSGIKEKKYPLKHGDIIHVHLPCKTGKHENGAKVQ
jgi:hypothetical protein